MVPKVEELAQHIKDLASFNVRTPQNDNSAAKLFNHCPAARTLQLQHIFCSISPETLFTVRY